MHHYGKECKPPEYINRINLRFFVVVAIIKNEKLCHKNEKFNSFNSIENLNFY